MTEHRSIHLLRRFWLAISTPKHYKSLFQQGFGRGLTTLLLACFLSSLTVGVAASAWIHLNIPQDEDFLSSLKSDFQTLYPEELVVQITDGSLRMNQEAPYSIEVPERWQELFRNEDSETFPYLLTIDPTGKVEDYAAYNSILLFTEKAVVYPSKSQSSETSDWQNVQTSFFRYDEQPDTANFYMDAEKYRTFESQLEPFIEKIPLFVNIIIAALLLILPFFVALFSWMWTLIYLCFATFLVWIVAMVMKKPHTYAQLYTLSIYGVILPLLLKAIANGVGIDLPFLFPTLVFVVWMGFVLKYTTHLSATRTKTKSTKKKQRLKNRA